MYERPINHRYDDPLDLIWVRAAQDLGLTVVRSPDAFAAYDGQGTLTISTAEHFDADDCLAQMIFHEICHWLVAGRKAIHQEDWGLSNLDDRDLTFEYAAIRTQVALAQPHGLREFLAVTTDWRPYWETLPADPLGAGKDPAIPLAREACHLARLEPFVSVLQRSLLATATIAAAVRDCVPPESLWGRARGHHRLGALLATDPSLRCGECAWASPDENANESATDVSIWSCRQHHEATGEVAPVELDERACEKWEPKFSIADCGACGACCRQGFDVVTVEADDPFLEKHRDLVQLDGAEYRVPRPNGLCVALDGDGSPQADFRCRHYDERPQNCRDFQVAGNACLLARRRVGLSR